MAASKKKTAKKKTTAKAESTTDRRPADEPYQPKHKPLQAAGLDHQAVEAERQAELTAERDTHNERTGDASL